MSRKVENWFHYSGVIHVHTTESDGTKTLEQIAAIGQSVGLDFMMFTDHMTLSNRDAGKEGYYGNLLVTVGYEHNDPDDNNHYLIFGSPRVYPSRMSATEYVAASAKDKALGIIAHPDEIRDRKGKYPPYPWTDWSPTDFDGIELWNQMSEWMERLGKYNRLSMAFSPRKSMIGPTNRLLKQWDEISNSRKYVGLASVDAHAFPIRVGPFTVAIFPYKVHFRSLRSYIILDQPLSPDLATAREQLFQAFRECRVYFANLRWGDASEFIFYADNGRERVPSGGELALSPSAQFVAKLPSKAAIRLIKDGSEIMSTTAREMVYEVSRPGLYRLETRKWGRGWIFTNHIRII